METRDDHVNLKESIGPTQAAQLLGVSVWTVVNWSDDGRLPVQRTACGHRRYDRKDIVAFINARKEGSK